MEVIRLSNLPISEFNQNNIVYRKAHRERTYLLVIDSDIEWEWHKTNILDEYGKFISAANVKKHKFVVVVPE